MSGAGDVLDSLLTEWDGHTPEVSTLEAALRDARVTMNQGEALWLATLGYLIVVEQLGRMVAKPSTRFRHRGGVELRFRAGALEFSANPDDSDLAGALFSLRCSLAHEYGLRNERRHVFILTRSNEFIRHASEPWDGTVEGAKRLDMNTVVNVRKVGSYVEGLVARVRTEHVNGNVVLAPGLNPNEAALFGGFNISQ
jgi:hypothetical protein